MWYGGQYRSSCFQIRPHEPEEEWIQSTSHVCTYVSTFHGTPVPASLNMPFSCLLSLLLTSSRHVDSNDITLRYT